MMNFSLNSHRKIFHSFLISVILIIISVFAIDLSLSLILKRYLKRISLDFRANLGLNLDFSNAYFDFFYGILINNLEINKNNNRIFDAKNIKINLDFLNTLSKRQLICKKILIQDSHIYKTDYLTNYYLSFLLENIKEGKGIIKSTIVKLYNLNFMDLISFDLNGYIALAQNKLLLTRGKIKIRKSAFLETTNDFKSKLLDSPLNYAVEMSFLDSDFVINKLDLTSHSARFILSGRIKDFNSSINLELKGELNNFLLEDIQILNNKYLRSNGIIEADFFINGPMNNINFKAEINMLNCNLIIFDALKINSINSNLIWDNQGLRSDRMTGLIVEAPLNLNLRIDNNDAHNKIHLLLSIQNLNLFDKVDINFHGNFLNKLLKGDIGIILDYTKDRKDFTTFFDCKDIHLNLNDLSFRGEAINLLISESDKSANEKKNKKIEFTKLSANLSVTQNNLLIDNIKANIYDGELEGRVNFGNKENTFFYNSKIYLSNLEIKNISKEFLSSKYQLSGLLSGKIVLDSEVSEAITGDIQIINGKIENNAVLIAISDFFGIPSLKTIDFSNLKILFRKIWDKYEAQINLSSADIWIYLDNKFFADGTMDGYLLAKLTTKLMDESRRFRRLFKYIEYKEPMVYFPFKLKGYMDKPRIEWLQNEFKEKIQVFLSPSKKTVLQNELNKLVEKFVQ